MTIELTPSHFVGLILVGAAGFMAQRFLKKRLPPESFTLAGPEGSRSIRDHAGDAIGAVRRAPWLLWIPAAVTAIACVWTLIKLLRYRATLGPSPGQLAEPTGPLPVGGMISAVLQGASSLDAGFSGWIEDCPIMLFLPCILALVFLFAPKLLIRRAEFGDARSVGFIRWAFFLGLAATLIGFGALCCAFWLTDFGLASPGRMMAGSLSFGTAALTLAGQPTVALLMGAFVAAAAAALRRRADVRGSAWRGAIASFGALFFYRLIVNAVTVLPSLLLWARSREVPVPEWGQYAAGRVGDVLCLALLPVALAAAAGGRGFLESFKAGLRFAGENLARYAAVVGIAWGLLGMTNLAIGLAGHYWAFLGLPYLALNALLPLVRLGIGVALLLSLLSMYLEWQTRREGGSPIDDSAGPLSQ